MAKAPQKPIPLSERNRQDLERQRAVYDSRIGETSDWGEFLTLAAMLGLVTLGVYLLADEVKHSGSSVTVSCPQCHQAFLMALPQRYQRYQQIACPYASCQQQLVVDIGQPAA